MRRGFAAACGPEKYIDVWADKGETTTFTLSCSEEDFLTFIDVALGYFTEASQEEHAHQADIFDVPKLQRVRGTTKHRRDVLSVVENERPEQLIDMVEMRKTWYPSSQDGHAFLSGNRPMFRALGESVSVTFDVSPKTAGIVIKGNDDTAVTEAAARLSVLEAYIASRPQVHHSLIRDAIMQPLMRLISLGDYVGMNGKVLIGGLQDLLMARVLDNSGVLVLLQEGLVGQRAGRRRQTTGHQPWKDHPLLSSQQTIGPSVDEWRTEIRNEEVLSDPFMPEITDQPEAKEAAPKTTTRKLRVPKGQNKGTTSKSATNTINGNADEKKADRTLAVQLDESTGQPPEIRPPHMPGQIVRQPPKPIEKITQESKRRSGPPKQQALIDFDGAADLTLQQRQGKVHIASGRTSMLVSFFKLLTGILRASLDCAGPTLKIRLGLFLFNKKSIRDKSILEQVFDPNQFKQYVGKEPDLDVKFVESLTSHYTDVPSILSLKASKGKGIFEEEPLERSEKYHFVCESGSREIVAVVIEPKTGEFSVRGLTRLQGAVNWYFIAHVWDAREC